MGSSQRYADFVADYATRPLQGLVMGLCEEAAEVLGLVSKHVFNGAPLDRARVVEELGDCLFYLTALANTFDISLDELQDANIAKLRKRYPDGPRGRVVRS